MVIRLTLSLLLCLFNLSVQSKSSSDNKMSVSFFQSEIEVAKSEIDLWQRELLTIKVDCITDEEFSYYTIETNPDNNSITESRKLKTVINEDGLFVKTVMIYIWPLNSGSQQLRLPSVKLMLSSRAIKTLALETLDLRIKPLPEYLPPGFPVGKISLSSDYRADALAPFILNPGELFNYQLDVSTKAIHASLLPQYSDYLSAATIQRLPVSQVIVNSTDNRFYSFNRSYHMPAVISSSGFKQFDDFKILSFDPADGKIISTVFSSVVMLSLNLLIQIFLLLIILYLLFKLLVYLSMLIKNIHYRRSLWQQIYQSHDAISLSIAVRKLSSDPVLVRTTAPLHDSNTSLSQWAHQWQSPSLLIAARLLNALVYSQSAATGFTEVKEQLIERLKAHEKCIYYGLIPAA